MPELRIDDLKLHYDVHGAGDPLLMVMGLGGSSAAWSPVLLDELARSFRVITYDNRGTGRSDKPDTPYSLEMFASDAIALLDHLKIDRTHLFGVSMGGMIAQEVALRYAPRLQTLTLGCTTCGGKHAVPPPPESLKLLTAPRDGISEAEVIRRGWPLGYTTSFIESHKDALEAAIPRLLEHPTPPYVYKRHLDATYGLNTWERLPQIATPTLVITGAEDVLIPARNSEILSQRIPGARLRILPQLGHAFFNQSPQSLIDDLAPFLKAHPINF